MEEQDILLPMSGTFHVVCPNADARDVYLFMRETCKELERDIDFYEHLIEQTTIEPDGDTTLVTFHWDEQDILTQYFAFKLQEKFAPEIQVTSTTHSELPDGTYVSRTAVLAGDDVCLDPAKYY